MRALWAHGRYVVGDNAVTFGAFLLFLLFVVAAVVGPLVVPYDPLASNTAQALKPPSRAHWFGTDQLGRDLLSRVVVATRLDLANTRALLSAVPGGLPGAGGPRIRLSGEPQSPIDPSPTTCRFYGRCPEGFDRCRTEMPVLPLERGEHAVACHLSRDGEAGTGSGSAQEGAGGVVGATLAEGARG